MKILLRPGLCSPEAAARIAADPLLARALGATPNAAVGFLFKKFMDASTPALDRLLALAQGEELTFLRTMEFTGKELDAANHLEVVCKVTVGQTRPDVDATRAEYQADTLHATAGRWKVRLPQRIYLSKPVRPDSICHVDQWTGEYVLGTSVAQALQASGLAGHALAPVLHPRTREPHDAALHLTTRHLLAPVEADATWFESHDDGPRAPTTPRRYGLLTYAAGALEPAPDFARTSEPWGAWGTPLWVVRQSVRQWVQAAQVRGWGFQPVVEQGTPLHAAHSAQWQAVLDKLGRAGARIMV